MVAAVFPPEPVVAANLYADLAKDLSKSFKVTVIRPYPTRPFGFKMPKNDFIDPAYNIITADSFNSPKSTFLGRMKESWSFGKYTKNYIKKNYKEIDLIYNGAWPLFGKWFVAKTAKKYGIPFITVVQDIYPESITSKLPSIPGIKKLVNLTLMPIDRFILKKSSGVHAISPDMKNYLSKTRHLQDEKVFVVRNWQDHTKFGEVSTLPSKDNKVFTFMYLGNIGPLAGLEVVLDAMRLINQDKYKFRVVIAGSGSVKENLRAKAKVLNILNIEFWDVPGGKVAETQDKADIMLLPVKRGFAKSSIPSKLPAYMFSARPILASVDAGSDTAISILLPEAGWVVEPENPEKVAVAMMKAMDTPIHILEQQGMNGREYAIKHFSKASNLCFLTGKVKEILN